jgi:hypothetical protein
LRFVLLSHLATLSARRLDTIHLDKKPCEGCWIAVLDVWVGTERPVGWGLVRPRTERRGSEMKEFGRRAALVIAATAATVGLTAIVAPASHAGESGWGCGGSCRSLVDRG